MTYNLKDIKYNNIEGYIVGYDNDRIQFLTGLEISSKTILIKPENTYIDQEFYENLKEGVISSSNLN